MTTQAGIDPTPLSQIAYPEEGSRRDAWILSRRPARNAVDPRIPYAFLVEDECSHTLEVLPIATIFLTNRECPWRCLMCDLWRNTLLQPVPPGAIPQQIRHALERLPPARQIKLYNSGSFFDSGAIPPGDYPEIASIIQPFERVVVESHPSLVGDSCLRLRDLIPGQIEVAMGLETVDPSAMERLNKKMTLDHFAGAASWLQSNGIDLRVFILLQPPFTEPSEALFWAERSLDFAFSCGATAITLIPTRAGNGATEALADLGRFQPPTLSLVEAALSYGFSRRQGRVFVDLWDADQIRACPHCQPERIERLRIANLTQQLAPPGSNSCCADHP